MENREKYRAQLKIKKNFSKYNKGYKVQVGSLEAILDLISTCEEEQRQNEKVHIILTAASKLCK